MTDLSARGVVRGLLLAAVCLFVPLTASADEVVDFSRDIRPILANKCFQCHGPDETTREAELRLDVREAAVQDGGPIVPGSPETSALLARVTEEDADLRMPPAFTKQHVTPAEVELLRKWIAAGAPYAQHWAFAPVADVTPPPVQQSEWVRNDIDRFILAQLERRGLTPSPEADPHTLIRRLHLDLIGLLPTPAQVDEFVAAYRRDADQAVDQLVTRLLDSRHYGERWGRHWLDQARYADSNGYTIDGERIMWPYRDWVIRALNEDMPFDQFTIEQLAGDLLDSPAKSQLVATGFHRNTLINQEGGTDDEQFRNEEVVDRVNTTGAVWLGLTVGCAQCHNHKFDPVSQREFYELFAFFNSTRDVNNTGPTVRVREGELLMQDVPRPLQQDLDAARQQLQELAATRPERQREWEREVLQQSESSSSPSDPAWQTLQPTEWSTIAPEVLSLFNGNTLMARRGHGNEVYNVSFTPVDLPVAAVRLRVLTHPTLPRNGPGLADNGNFVLTGFEIWQGDRQLTISEAQADHAQPRFPIQDAINGDTQSGWAINVGSGTPKGVRMNADHEAHFTLAEPLEPGGPPLRVVLRHEKENHNFYCVGRFAVDVSSHAPEIILTEPVLEALRQPPEKRTDAQKKLLADEFAQRDAEANAVRAEMERIRQRMGLGAEVSTMVMQELDQPRETYIHIRGDFLRKQHSTGPLTPDVPAVLPPLSIATAQGSGAGDSEEHATRLDLARWLVHPAHPLTSRVTVNRVWMRYFGRGIVETENDFGTQGALPTHPQLLDWLARRFVESGWSLKALHRLIVTSATYRQSSHHRSELEQSDPLNRLLARQNRLRLDAEIIRDAALSASGLLNPRIGGPSVRPPQPAGVYAFTQTNKNWRTSPGEQRFRRGLYTQFYRSAPYPMLITFDAPDFQSVCTRRPRSNTPLQSLTLANDAAFFEMAQGLAARLMREVPSVNHAAQAAAVADGPSTGNRDAQRVRHAFRVCFAREPDAVELSTLTGFVQQQRRRFENLAARDPSAVHRLAPDDIPEGFTPAAAAAWTAVARAVMNTDEFITRE